jgi:hypothetical protein
MYSFSGNCVRPQSQCPQSCVCERFGYIPKDWFTYFLQQNRQTDHGIICVNRSQTHECGIGTEAPQFLFWEYLFQIFGILSWQCKALGNCTKIKSSTKILQLGLQEFYFYILLVFFYQKTLSHVEGGGGTWKM